MKPVPRAVGGLDPCVRHQVNMAVGVALTTGQVQNPGGLDLQAADLVLGAPGPHPGDRDT